MHYCDGSHIQFEPTLPHVPHEKVVDLYKVSEGVSDALYDVGSLISVGFYSWTKQTKG